MAQNVNEPAKMKTVESFTLFRKHLGMCGIILQPPSSRNSYTFHFNSKNLTVIILTIFGGIATNKLIDDAKSFDEYTDILYRTIFMYIITVIYTYIIWKTPELFVFVNSLEDNINRSK